MRRLRVLSISSFVSRVSFFPWPTVVLDLNELILERQFEEWLTGSACLLTSHSLTEDSSLFILEISLPGPPSPLRMMSRALGNARFLAVLNAWSLGHALCLVDSELVWDVTFFLLIDEEAKFL